MKRVLITAGQVYGKLDDNKLVGNRVRGAWALRFAEHLAEFDWREDATEDYRVTLLVPDTMPESYIQGYIGKLARPNIRVVYHNGFHDYRAKCLDFALDHDAAVLAAAVVNWIPAEPFPGKMPTEGYEVGDTIDVPFVLAPRVINELRDLNPNLTLIGCKMLIGAERHQLLGAAEGVLRASKAHVVIANDQTHLRDKLLVFPDRTVLDYAAMRSAADFDVFYEALRAIIDDTHWSTRCVPEDYYPSETALLFDRIVDKYRDRFYSGGGDKVFGSVLVPGEGYLASPRIKRGDFTSANAAHILGADFNAQQVTVGGSKKATMNAPLMVRMAETYIATGATPRKAVAVLHLHEQLEGVPTEPYAPPGTARDSARPIHMAFNIEGHGFVALLDENLEIILP